MPVGAKLSAAARNAKQLAAANTDENDLEAAEQFSTARARVAQTGLYAGVGPLVQAQRVAPLRGEGAVLEGALEDHLRLVDSLVSLQITGGGERFLTGGADIVFCFIVE